MRKPPKTLIRQLEQADKLLSQAIANPWCDGMGELPRARATSRLCNIRLSLSDLRHELAKLRGEG